MSEGSRPRRVMVTGAAGLIGRAVLDLLHELDVTVTALVRPDEQVKADRVVLGDATDPLAVDDAVAGADAVVHLAALPSPNHASPDEVFGMNTRATFTVLDRAGAAGVRRASIASSLSILGLPWARRRVVPAYLPLDMATPLQIEDPYGLSKQVDEATAQVMARRHDMTIVALRYPFVVDAHRGEQRRKVLTADPGSGAVDAWAYLDDRDAARAAWLGIARPLRGYHALFVAAPDTAAPYRTADLLARFLPDVPLRRPVCGRDVPIDLGDADRLLGFTARYTVQQDEQPLP